MKFEKISTNYCLKLSKDQWNALENFKDDIFTLTEQLGVYRLNWSGHFGPYLFFLIDDENKMITIKNFKKWLKENLGANL
jgi:hypothetical protein